MDVIWGRQRRRSISDDRIELIPRTVWTRVASVLWVVVQLLITTDYNNSLLGLFGNARGGGLLKRWRQTDFIANSLQWWSCLNTIAYNLIACRIQKQREESIINIDYVTRSLINDVFRPLMSTDGPNGGSLNGSLLLGFILLQNKCQIACWYWQMLATL